MALVALGVTGGIGAYKAVEIARLLQQRGHDVTAVMTRSARRFVGPVTFEAITRRPVLTDQFARGINAEIEHISLASEIALLLVAPATANIIGKFANGIADDFLSSLYLATRAPVLLAPAMNTNMLAHEAVQRNLEALSARGVRFVEPGEGYLACGWIGKGRLAEPAEIAAAADALVRPVGSLVGRTIVVSAGPTYEDLDPVRYVGNRSSGRMGYAIAGEAARRGARVVLVSGPTELAAPAGAEIIRVRSAAEMRDAVVSQSSGADAVVMSAAVADYTTEDGPASSKLTKDDERMTIRLVRTRDILAELGASRGDRTRPVLVGFAAETGEAQARAREKLTSKKVDLIVANDVSQPGAGFEVPTNVATLVTHEGDEPLPLQSKSALAAVIIDRIETMLASTPKASTPR
jgi:phosphopantothenoylcysteine decarboxylase/phosphopantothenate--cysteine ligase